MKDLCITSLVLVLAACGAGDDVAEGARANCAYGGLLTDCEDAERTPEGACWRMVDCGAIAITDEGENRDWVFDWDRCVNTIEGMTAEKQRWTINCIAASSCDQLRVDGSPEQPNGDQLYCIQLGAR
jgi:hypothetical protein